MLAIFLTVGLIVPAAQSGGVQGDDVQREVDRWIRVMATPEEGQRFEAMQNLARLGEVALPRVLALLADQEQSFVRRWQAAMTAGSIGGEGVAGALLEALRHDPSPVVARVAADQLGRVGGEGVLEGLEGAMKLRTEKDVRDVIAKSIAALGGEVRSGAAPAQSWVQPFVRTGTDFVEAWGWAPTVEAALERARDEGKLVLATIVPLDDRRWTFGFEAAAAEYGAVEPPRFGNQRAMSIEAGLTKERALLQVMLADERVARLVRDHFVPVRVRLHTYRFDLDHGSFQDPLAKLGHSAQRLGGPALLASTATGEALGSLERIGVFAPEAAVRLLARAVADAGRESEVDLTRGWPAELLAAERAWRGSNLDAARRGAQNVRRESPAFAAEAAFLEGLIADRLGNSVEAQRLWRLARELEPTGAAASQATTALDDRTFVADRWRSRTIALDLLGGPSTEVGRALGGDRLRVAGELLLDLQCADGSWPDPSYDLLPAGGRGTRYDRSTPRTALAVHALLELRAHGALPGAGAQGAAGARVDDAVDRGVAFVARFADAPQPWVWHLTYALDLQLALLRNGVGDADAARRRASTLIGALAESQQDGGWSYMPAPRVHSFNTALVILGLVEARALGIEVPDALLAGAVEFLAGLRQEDDGRNFHYAPTMPFPTKASSCRTALCELALGAAAGDYDEARLSSAVELFLEHEEGVRSTTKVYESYFSARVLHDAYHYTFGHLYAARTLRHLPARRAQDFARSLLERLEATQEIDGSFVDAQLQGKAASTAMAVLAILEARRSLK